MKTEDRGWRVEDSVGVRPDRRVSDPSQPRRPAETLRLEFQTRPRSRNGDTLKVLAHGQGHRAGRRSAGWARVKFTQFGQVWQSSCKLPLRGVPPGTAWYRILGNFFIFQRIVRVMKQPKIGSSVRGWVERGWHPGNLSALVTFCHLLSPVGNYFLFFHAPGVAQLGESQGGTAHCERRFRRLSTPAYSQIQSPPTFRNPKTVAIPSMTAICLRQG
jgi:hypothetical protein